MGQSYKEIIEDKLMYNVCFKLSDWLKIFNIK